MTRLPPRTSQVCLSAALPAPGKDICYRPFGCFSDEQPWTGTLQRPLKLFPWSPEDIDTRFLLFTNENPNNFQVRAGRRRLQGGRGWAPALEPRGSCLKSTTLPPWDVPGGSVPSVRHLALRIPKP